MIASRHNGIEWELLFFCCGGSIRGSGSGSRSGGGSASASSGKKIWLIFSAEQTVENLWQRASVRERGSKVVPLSLEREWGGGGHEQTDSTVMINRTDDVDMIRLAQRNTFTRHACSQTTR